jgi:hypothetical protein
LGRWAADALVGLCTPFSRRWRGEGTVYRRACVNRNHPRDLEIEGRLPARIMFLFD